MKKFTLTLVNKLLICPYATLIYKRAKKVNG